MAFGLGPERVFVALGDRLDQPPVQLLVDNEMAESAGCGDADPDIGVPVPDGAADCLTEIQAAPERRLVRRKKCVQVDRQCCHAGGIAEII